MRRYCEGLLKMLLMVASFSAADAQAQEAQPAAVLFDSVRIFDGTGSALSALSNMPVRGNKIEKISTAPIAWRPDHQYQADRESGQELRGDHERRKDIQEYRPVVPETAMPDPA